MAITASASGSLAFKVKTTHPKRYLVRPSQGLLRPGERQDVSILVPPERLAELLREEEQGRIEDKFQVVYAGMDEATAQRISADKELQHERVDRFWAQLGKRSILECRLEVEVVCAPQSSLSMAEYRKRYDDLVTCTVRRQPCMPAPQCPCPFPSVLI